MEIKILQVFYDKNGLPYKDKERTVHYPITSGTFLGASNTTKIRFYYDQLDELNESTFVAVSKLPNGKIGSEILESEYDSELQENYAILNLSQFYTQYKGDVFISLQGYQGGVRVEQDENGIYSIIGTPTIQATGSIKLSIAYAPTFIGSGETENITLQRVLAELSTKLGIRQETLHVEELPTVGNPNVWYVINDDPSEPTKANIYIWNATTQTYVWVGDNTLDLGDYYTKEEGQDFEEEINQRITNVENTFNGSPKGVYTTLSDLETAYPSGTNGIYVVSADGHWYYWNGSAWTDGGTYQATEIADGSVTYPKLSETLKDNAYKYIGNKLNPSFNNGYFITNTGSVVANEDFKYSQPIYVGEKTRLFVRARGYETNVSILSKTNESGTTFEPVITSIDGTYQVYTALVGEGYYSVCGNIDSEIIVISKYDCIIGEDDLNETYNIIGDRITPNFVDGYFINATGQKIQHSDFKYSQPIFAKKGTKLYVKSKGYSTNVAIISTTNSSGSEITQASVISKDSNYNWYRYDVYEDNYFIVCGNVDSEIIVILEDKLNNLLYPYMNNGYFILRDGTVNANEDFAYSSPLFIKGGSKISIKARGYSDIITILSETNANGDYHNPLIICSDGEYKWYDFVVNKNGFYSVCGNVDSEIIVKYDEITNGEKEKFSSSISMFEKIAVIGDSFASGVIYIGGTAYTKYNLSWIQNIARRNGIVAQNYSRGGATTRSWLTDEQGLTKMLNNQPDNLYILAMGINDKYLDSGNYLGTISDINDSDPTQNADTFYGNYGKIIEAIKVHSPNAKIIMSTMSSKEGWNVSEFNDAIINIANHYSIPVIYQYNDEYFNSSNYKCEMVNDHPTAVGYGEMSKALERLINECISSNRSYFNDYLGN